MNQTTTPADLDARVSEALSRENTGSQAERIAEVRSRWPTDLGELAVEVPSGLLWQDVAPQHQH